MADHGAGADWFEYGSAEAMADVVASDVGAIIEDAVAARGKCLLVLPGGKSPIPIFRKLSTLKIGWDRVTILPGDDRLVSRDDPLSNGRLLASHFAPLGAQIVPLANTSLLVREAGDDADERVRLLSFPSDLIWLGMGANGHTASIFHGPNFEEALTSPNHVIGLTPEPLPPEAPVARLTLTRSAILNTRTILVTINGEEKKRVLKEALLQGVEAEWPIGRVLANAGSPISIHWTAG